MLRVFIVFPHRSVTKGIQHRVHSFRINNINWKNERNKIFINQPSTRSTFLRAGWSSGLPSTGSILFGKTGWYGWFGWPKECWPMVCLRKNDFFFQIVQTCSMNSWSYIQTILTLVISLNWLTIMNRLVSIQRFIFY